MKTKSLHPKDIAGLPMEEKFQFAQFGLAADAHHFKAARMLESATTTLLELERIRGDSSHPALAERIESLRKRAAEMFFSQFAKSWHKRDGSFFRSLADAIEAKPEGVRPAWSYVAAQIEAAKAFKRPRPSIAALTQGLSNVLGREVDPKETKRILKYLELSKLPQKAGRPRNRK